jgi:hypothetical protein
VNTASSDEEDALIDLASEDPLWHTLYDLCVDLHRYYLGI